jgi:3-oxoacyl-[acyl-carrier protein] reductase
MGRRPDRRAPARLINTAVEALGAVDILVCNHARSGSDGPLGTLDAAMLDAHWAVNTRTTILLTQAFAARHEQGRRRLHHPHPGRPVGRPRHHPQHGQPGPGRHRLRHPEAHEAVRRRFPAGRWGEPDDPARLIAWLTTDEASWITGQIINSEGGFRR